MTIEQMGILLSLLITMIGWGVTAFYQRRILERQIAAEREKEVRQLIVPPRVQQLQEIKSWLQTGLSLISLKLSDLSQEPQKEYVEWKSQYFKTYLLASQLEFWFPDYNRVDSKKLQEVIADYAENMEKLMSHQIDGANARGIAVSIGRLSITATEQLDRLIELSAIQEVGKARKKRH